MVVGCSGSSSSLSMGEKVVGVVLGTDECGGNVREFVCECARVCL